MTVEADPAAGTLERWAWEYMLSSELAYKLAPPQAPDGFEEAAPARRLLRPGRPPELQVVGKSRIPKSGLNGARARARLLHAFAHHELQAAELMCWALLAFPDAPAELRRGLRRIALDEIRHLDLYRIQIERLGFHFGAFPVRDWFWERVPQAQSISAFLAVMGMGLEGANLDHSEAFAERFREAGDEEGARAQELVGREEIAHVRFGVHWFRILQGESTGRTLASDEEFERWVEHLPPPLSPLLMRGKTIARAARLEAGLSEAHIEQLQAWQPHPHAPGS